MNRNRKIINKFLGMSLPKIYALLATSLEAKAYDVALPVANESMYF